MSFILFIAFIATIIRREDFGW